MSNTRPTDDAIVVGGGPAGATAARLLASWGHRVALLSRPSSRRALAESLPPSGVHVLGRIGVRERVLAAGFVRASGNTVWWGNAGTTPRVEYFPTGTFGLQVQRAAFDAILRSAAADAGVTVLDGASVRDVGEEGEGKYRRVRFELAGALQDRTCAWALDCSGRARALSREIPVNHPSPRTTALVGVWHHGGDAGWPTADWTHTTVESGPNGWAWSIPTSLATRYVTVMLDPTLTDMRGGDGLQEAYASALSRFPRHADLTKAARLVEPPFAVDATSYQSARITAAGTLTVGDAASFIDPLASFGVKKAMASAWLAAVVVHTALTEPSMTEASLDLFERWERQSRAALLRGVSEFARLAALDDGAAASSAYWRQRTEEEVAEPEGELDARAMRTDPNVTRALGELRGRETLSVRMSSSCSLVERAVVKGNRVAMEAQLRTPDLPGGARFIRNIDLVQLARLAVGHTSVPDIMDDYNRRYPPAGLPDLLGALAVLVGKGVLEIA